MKDYIIHVNVLGFNYFVKAKDFGYRLEGLRDNASRHSHREAVDILREVQLKYPESEMV